MREKTAIEKILRRALEMACAAAVRGDCRDCPIKGNKDYCTEWTGTDDCSKQLRDYLILKAKEAK